MFDRVKNLPNSPTPSVTIICNDEWMRASTTDEDGGPLPVGKTKRYYFSQCILTHTNHSGLIL